MCLHFQSSATVDIQIFCQQTSDVNIIIALTPTLGSIISIMTDFDSCLCRSALITERARKYFWQMGSDWKLTERVKFWSCYVLPAELGNIPLRFEVELYVYLTAKYGLKSPVDKERQVHQMILQIRHKDDYWI